MYSAYIRMDHGGRTRDISSINEIGQNRVRWKRHDGRASAVIVAGGATLMPNSVCSHVTLSGTMFPQSCPAFSSGFADKNGKGGQGHEKLKPIETPINLILSHHRSNAYE